MNDYLFTTKLSISTRWKTKDYNIYHIWQNWSESSMPYSNYEKRSTASSEWSEEIQDQAKIFFRKCERLFSNIFHPGSILKSEEKGFILNMIAAEGTQAPDLLQSYIQISVCVINIQWMFIRLCTLEWFNKLKFQILVSLVWNWNLTVFLDLYSRLYVSIQLHVIYTTLV